MNVREGDADKPSVLVLYHGTSHGRIDSIRRNGLSTPDGAFDSPTWFMLTDNFMQAVRYGNGRPGAVVLEYRIPPEEVWRRGTRNAVLWPGARHEVYDTLATAYALKAPIKGTYIHAVHGATLVVVR